MPPKNTVFSVLLMFVVGRTCLERAPTCSHPGWFRLFMLLCCVDSRNSLSVAMMETLIENLTRGQHEPDLRAIVISSVGPIFSAGHNLKELVNCVINVVYIFKSNYLCFIMCLVKVRVGYYRLNNSFRSFRCCVLVGCS